MPNIEVRGKYRTFRYDGDSPLDFTTYNSLLCVVRRPNPTTFITLQQYVPGQGGPFTTFSPGSSYTIVTRADGTQGNFNFDIGPYTRVDRLPPSTFVKSPNFYIGLDKNSITVPISSYALSVNNPLSSVVNIVYTNGQGNRLQYVYADNFKTGAPLNFTHFLPNSGYELRNRIPFTFFAPLQSEMGDAYATGVNTTGQLGMGYQYNSYGYTQLYGNWDKVVISYTHAAALSAYGTKKKIFVCGSNGYGQLGLTQVVNGSLQSLITTTQTVWKELKNIWTWDWDNNVYRDILLTEDILDVEVGADFTLIKTNLRLYGCGLMGNMGIAPPGEFDVEFGTYQFKDISGSTVGGVSPYYIPYFTPYLLRTPSTLLSQNLVTDTGSYSQILSNNINKFQARDLRWFWLDSVGRLYGAGRIAGSMGRTTTYNMLPIGYTALNVNYNSSTQLYGPGDYKNRFNDQFFADFNAGTSNIAALSTDFKTWLVGGMYTSNFHIPSLSTVCFFDPVQNAYVPQNNYYLRLLPTELGFIGIYNNKLYSSCAYSGFPQFGFGPDASNRLPASTLPKINGALNPNPAEQARFRTLIPLTYMSQPDISWKSLYCSTYITAAVDNNNKLYVCGRNDKGQLGFQYNQASPSTSIFILTSIIPDDIFNVNINDNNLIVYKTNRNPAPSPTPIPSPTPTPTTSPRPQPVYNTGEVLYMNTNSPGLNVGASSNSSAYWFTDILFSTFVNCPALDPTGMPISKLWTYNLYQNITAPPDAKAYNHYSYRNYVSTQIEPRSFGARKCSVFNDSTRSSDTTDNLPNLCFHYFSQNKNSRSSPSNQVQCDYPYGTVSKMAPNSGTFGDGRSSTQRIVIDTRVGAACQPHFYIHPYDNSYHVIYTKRTGDPGYETQYSPYYITSADRGVTWSTPLRLDGGSVYTSSTIMNLWFPNNNAGKCFINNCTPFITTKKTSQAKPAVLYSSSNGGAYDTVNLICKISINSNFDRYTTLASGYNQYSYGSMPPGVEKNSCKAGYDPEFSHHKLLYDNKNNLIALWTGTVGDQFNSQTYAGPGPCRIQYNYMDQYYNWTTTVTAANTFPRIHDVVSCCTNNYYAAGRQWDACIDDSDNNLCIAYTPDAVLSNGKGWNAWVLKVKKINIFTGAVIFDEVALDITSLTNTSTTKPKGIGAIQIYFDNSRNKIVVIASTRGAYSSTISTGSTLLYERTGTNAWSKLNPVLTTSLDQDNWSQNFMQQLNVI